MLLRGLTKFVIQAKPTHQTIIRLAPPLVVTKEELKRAVAIIEEAVHELSSLSGKKADDVIPPEERNVNIGVDS